MSRKNFPSYPRTPHRSGQARIRLDGRDRYLGKFKSPESWAEYERLLAEWRLRNRDPEIQVPDSPVRTVADVSARFLIHAKQHYRNPEGKQTDEYRDYVLTLKPLLRLYGHTLARDFGPLALKAVREAMVTGGWLTPEEAAKRLPHQRRWNRKLINQRINRIRRMWKWAASEQLVSHTIYDALRMVAGLQRGRTPAPDYPEVEPVADVVIEATLPHLSPTIRAMVELQRLTGMRPGEVVIMRPGDLDRDSLKIGDMPIWVYRPARHKNAWRGFKSAIVIGPKAQDVLRPFLDRDPEAYCFQPPMRFGPRPSGRHYTVGSYGARIRLVCRRHGIAPWHPHQLRHAASTEIGSIFGLDEARAVLGHKDPKITALYAARDLKQAAQVVAQLG